MNANESERRIKQGRRNAKQQTSHQLISKTNDKPILFRAEPSPQSGCFHIGMGGFCVDLGMTALPDTEKIAYN